MYQPKELVGSVRLVGYWGDFSPSRYSFVFQIVPLGLPWLNSSHCLGNPILFGNPAMKKNYLRRNFPNDQHEKS